MNENAMLTGKPSIDRPWMKFYPDVLRGIQVPACTVEQYLSVRAADPNVVAMHYYGVDITWGTVFRKVDATARALQVLGIKQGDQIPVFLRSVPADVEQGSAEDLLVELADKLSKGSRDALSEKTEWVLHSISCRAAIKAGDKTSPQELMALAEKILSGEVPPFCPHGRPCVLKITRKELEKQFGRLV